MTFLQRLTFLTVGLILFAPVIISTPLNITESSADLSIKENNSITDNNITIRWFEGSDPTVDNNCTNSFVIETNELATEDFDTDRKFNKSIILEQKFFDVFVTSVENSPFGKNIRRKLIRYLLRSRYARSYYPLQRDGSDAEPRWVPGGTVKILVHGFTHQVDKPPEERISNSRWFQLADEYIASGRDLNVIILDWTELSTYPVRFYPEAVDSSRYAGRDVAEFIIKLKNRGLVTYDNVHIIGFSLGCHVAGVAGHVLWQKTGSKVGRITGLDPAGPLFVKGDKLIDDKSKVLDKSDADFVDIIHCNMGDVLEGRWGSPVEAGHADFYPNGGFIQPACNLINNVFPGCSHHKCPEFYLDSVNKRKLEACRCQTYDMFIWGLCDCRDEVKVDMGDLLDTRKASGRYYLRA